MCNLVRSASGNANLIIKTEATVPFTPGVKNETWPKFYSEFMGIEKREPHTCLEFAPSTERNPKEYHLCFQCCNFGSSTKENPLVCNPPTHPTPPPPPFARQGLCQRSIISEKQANLCFSTGPVEAASAKTNSLKGQWKPRTKKHTKIGLVPQFPYQKKVTFFGFSLF